MERFRKKMPQYSWGDPPGPPGPPIVRQPQLPRDTNMNDEAPPSPTWSTSSLSTLTDLDSDDSEDVPTLMSHPSMTDSTLSHVPKPVISTRGWTMDGIIALSSHFRRVSRVSAIDKDLESKIKEFESTGVPLIIEGYHNQSDWPKEMFSVDWFLEHGPQEMDVRNVHNRTDKTMSTSNFIGSLRSASPYVTPEETERLYGKDAECPKEWDKWLSSSNVIPSCLLPDSSENVLLNQTIPVETLMCYLGPGDTSTPAHKDLCASTGQNIMCYSEKGGSSYWFMTEGSAAPGASSYFHKLNQELDHETYLITLEELAKAPFNVYIAEQKLGDMVLVPPRSCHQVVNHGGITIKLSWSRMRLQDLPTALYHELPIYQRVGRLETYRIRSTIHRTLIRRAEELRSTILPHSEDVACPSVITVTSTHLPISSSYDDSTTRSHETRKARLQDLELLLSLFDHILVEECPQDNDSFPCIAQSSHSPTTSSNGDMPSSTTSSVKDKGDDFFTCDFCGADIFQSFFECRRCVEPQLRVHGNESSLGNGFVLCVACYVDGRSCKCECMDPIQCRPFSELLQDRRNAFQVLQLAKQTHEEADERFLTPGEPGLFRAACVLWQMRKRKIYTLDEFKACSGTKRKRDPSPHPVNAYSSVYCKRCDSTSCLQHILDGQRIHAAQVFLSQSNDSTHKRWHNLHRTSKSDYNTERLHKLEKEGKYPPLQQRLVYTALRFRICRSMSTFAKLGWYDKPMQLLEFSKEALQTSVGTLGTLPLPPRGQVGTCRPVCSDGSRWGSLRRSMVVSSSAISSTPRKSNSIKAVHVEVVLPAPKYEKQYQAAMQKSSTGLSPAENLVSTQTPSSRSGQPQLPTGKGSKGHQARKVNVSDSRITGLKANPRVPAIRPVLETTSQDDISTPDHHDVPEARRPQKKARNSSLSDALDHPLETLIRKRLRFQEDTSTSVLPIGRRIPKTTGDRTARGTYMPKQSSASRSNQTNASADLARTMNKKFFSDSLAQEGLQHSPPQSPIQLNELLIRPNESLIQTNDKQEKSNPPPILDLEMTDGTPESIIQEVEWLKHKVDEIGTENQKMHEELKVLRDTVQSQTLKKDGLPAEQIIQLKDTIVKGIADQILPGSYAGRNSMRGPGPPRSPRQWKSSVRNQLNGGPSYWNHTSRRPKDFDRSHRYGNSCFQNDGRYDRAANMQYDAQVVSFATRVPHPYTSGTPPGRRPYLDVRRNEEEFAQRSSTYHTDLRVTGNNQRFHHVSPHPTWQNRQDADYLGETFLPVGYPIPPDYYSRNRDERLHNGPIPNYSRGGNAYTSQPTDDRYHLDYDGPYRQSLEEPSGGFFAEDTEMSQILNHRQFMNQNSFRSIGPPRHSHWSNSRGMRNHQVNARGPVMNRRGRTMRHAEGPRSFLNSRTIDDTRPRDGYTSVSSSHILPPTPQSINAELHPTLLDNSIQTDIRSPAPSQDQQCWENNYEQDDDEPQVTGKDSPSRPEPLPDDHPQTPPQKIVTPLPYPIEENPWANHISASRNTLGRSPSPSLS